MNRLRQALAWRPSDPGRFALANAVRAAIVIPIALVIGRSIGSPQTPIFAVFGSVAMLVFADFGGPPSTRLFAYLVLAAVGFTLIPIGTVLSPEPVIAAVAMAVVGFVILFSGVINGYLAAGGTAALLTFVLPVMLPAPVSQIPDRLLGFAVACVLAIPAAMLLFRKRPRDRLRAGVATACDAVADLVEDPAAANDGRARAALDAVRRVLSSMPFRPSGPTGATGALALMIDELGWLRAVSTFSARVSPGAQSDCEAKLRRRSVATLRSCAELLRDGDVPPPDDEALERSRSAVIDEALQMVSEPAIRDDDERLWAAIFGAWEVKLISHGVIDISRLATIAANREAGPRDRPSWLAFIGRQSVALSTSGRTILAHADVRSVWFRNSLRGSLGLALAVLLSRLVRLEYAFWTVLGSLSVLRSTALSTGATIVRAVIGTTIGIVIGGVLLTAIGSDTTVLWIILPFAALLSAYAPRAVSFAAGQAGFTVMIFIVFDLIVPTGWKIGLVRLEDVTIGFAVSLLVGLLFWPRGATAIMRRSIAAAIAAAARYADAAWDGVLAGGADEQMHRCQAESAAAQSRLDTAFRQRLAERAGDEPKVAQFSRLATATVHIYRTAAIEHGLADKLGDTPRPPAAAQLDAGAQQVADWYLAFGERFTSRAAVPRASAPDPLEHPAMLAAVREAAAAGRDETMAALACAWAGLHIDELRRLEGPVADAAQALQQPSSNGSDHAPDAGRSARSASALAGDRAGELDVTQPVGGRAHAE